MSSKQLPAILQKRLDQVVRKLRAKPSTRAIFVGGSIGRGTADQWSDIDILVIKRQKPSFIRYYDGTLDIEIESTNLSAMRKKLAQDPPTWYTWQNLKPLYDLDNFAPRIHKLLKNYKVHRRTKPKTLGDLYIRLRHRRQKCARGGRNQADDAAIAISAMGNICRAEIALRNIIMPPSALLFNFCLNNFSANQALQSALHRTLTGRIQAHQLVPLIDKTLRRLKPVMKKFTKYYKPWKVK